MIFDMVGQKVNDDPHTTGSYFATSNVDFPQKNPLHADVELPSQKMDLSSVNFCSIFLPDSGKNEGLEQLEIQDVCVTKDRLSC